MSRIFISYRRSQSRAEARALFESLRRRFGTGRVFMDVEGIAPGQDFQEVLDAQLAHCAVMLCLVGKGWADVRDDAGELRLHDPNDFVRLEIETALQRRIPLVPILLEGATMPPTRSLPECLAAFTRRHGLKLDHDSWDGQVGRLFQALATYLEPADKASNGVAAVAPAPSPAPSPTAPDRDLPSSPAATPPAAIWTPQKDRFGWYGEVVIEGASQRFRWIEPGTFLMGSPKNSPSEEAEKPNTRSRSRAATGWPRPPAPRRCGKP